MKNYEGLKKHQFKPGQSGNPGGRPVGSRNQLQKDFWRAMAEDFNQHGKETLERVRKEKPAEYIRAVVALMPKELEISRGLDELTDDQLNAALIAARALLAAQTTGAGASQAQEPEST